MTRYIDAKFFAMALQYRLFIIVAVLAVIAIFSWKSRQLKLSGLLAAALMGFASMYIAGFSALLLYLFFFLTAAALGWLSKRVKKKEGVKQEKGGRRDIFQVLANGGLALLALLAYKFTSDKVFLMLFSATLAESAADTWAGEVGSLSPSSPVSLITGKRVERGTSGGVTLLGLAASLVCCVLFGLLYISSFESATVSLASLLSVTAFLGSVADSFLGASVQALYYDEEEGMFSEKRIGKDGKELKLVKGFKFFNNDMVNFCSNLITFIFALSMSALIA